MGRGDTAVGTKSQCSLLGCEWLAFASLARYSLCRRHFFSGCRAGFEMCDDLLQHRSARNVQLTWQFVVECEAGMLELSRQANGLQYCEQTELVELLLRLDAIKRRLRSLIFVISTPSISMLAVLATGSIQTSTAPTF